MTDVPLPHKHSVHLPWPMTGTEAALYFAVIACLAGGGLAGVLIVSSSAIAGPLQFAPAVAYLAAIYHFGRPFLRHLSPPPGLDRFLDNDD